MADRLERVVEEVDDVHVHEVRAEGDAAQGEENAGRQEGVDGTCERNG